MNRPFFAFILLSAWVEFSVAQFPNVAIDNFTSTIQRQPRIAVAPTTQLIASTWNQFVQSESRIGLAVSPHRGLWYLNLSSYIEVPGDDPSVAFGTERGEYSASLYVCFTRVGGVNNPIELHWTDDFLTFENSTVSTGPYDQKDPRVIVDINSESEYRGHVYVTWIDELDRVKFTYSTDDGFNWESEIELGNPDGDRHDKLQGEEVNRCWYPDIAIATNGDIYVVWLRYDTNENKGIMILRRSVNGGKSFGNPVTIADDFAGVRLNNIGEAGARVRPSLTISPVNGHVFMVTSDARNEHDSDPILRFFRSENSGSSWSETQIDDLGEGYQYFFPQVVVTPKGSVYIAYNHAFGEEHVAQYMSKSYDDGESFGEGVQISEEYATNTEKFETYYDADAVANLTDDPATDDAVFLAWTDHRDNYPAPYSASILTTEIHVPDDWRMMGIPHYLDSYYRSDVFPGLSSNEVFVQTQYGYQAAPNPLPEDKGLWVNYPNERGQRYLGAWKDNFEMSVFNGWNIIGSISGPVSTSAVIENGVTVISSYFGLDEGGYVAVSTLEPGHGYWVHISGTGSLILPFQYPLELSNNDHPLLVQNPEVNEVLDEFIVVDSRGYRQRLKVASAGNRMEMPPDGPGEAGINVRFGSGNFREVVRVEDGVVGIPISLRRVAYPITLTWHLNREVGVSYWIKNGNVRTPLDTNGSIVFQNATGGTISLEARATVVGKAGQPIDVLPVTFNLQEPFPNPFNPTTEIRFELPQAGQVSLVVHDVLGRNVTDLVSGFREAGYYSTRWNADNQASGVYFVRLQVINAEGKSAYTKVNKLVLMK